MILCGPVRRYDSGLTLELGELTLAAGETRTEEIALGDRKPGSVRIFVSRGGLPLPGHLVLIGDRRSHVAGLTSGDGTAVVTPIFPGEWTIAIERPGQGEDWKYLHPIPIIVEPGMETECAVDVCMILGRVRILDSETEEPLRNCPVHLTRPDETMTGCWSDAEGWLDLMLNPGQYKLAVLGSHPDPGAELIWTSAGPAQAEIKLGRSHFDEELLKKIDEWERR